MRLEILDDETSPARRGNQPESSEGNERRDRRLDQGIGAFEMYPSKENLDRPSWRKKTCRG